MRVLVTGTSGHIGGAVARYLAAQGIEVHAVSRSHADDLPDTVFQYALDTAHRSFCEQAVERIETCDAVIHAAACQSQALTDPEISRVNCFGTQQVLKLSRSLHASTFLYFSSLSLLGQPRTHPIAETHPVAPNTAYGASKLFGEHLCLLAHSESFRTIALRVSSPVGPGLRHRRLFRIFVESALQGSPLLVAGSGKRRQDYVDVRDIACAVHQILNCECHGIYNLGSGNPISNLELAQRCVSTLHSPSTVTLEGGHAADDDICWDLCLDKAHDDFGYSPRHTLKQSISDLAAELR